MIFNVHEEERAVLQLISQAGKELGMAVYIVGGIVRDRFLGRPSNDIDIVCLGSGIALAEKVLISGYFACNPGCIIGDSKNSKARSLPSGIGI